MEESWSRDSGEEAPYLVEVGDQPPQKGKTPKVKGWREDPRSADGAEPGAADYGTMKNDISDVPPCPLWGEMWPQLVKRLD